MSRKLKGFSLAELLIALLVISIVLSAAIPTMTRKSKSSEQVWRWTEKQSNNAYFGVGSTQTAIIGAAAVPDIQMIANTFNRPTTEPTFGSLSNLKLTLSGDKLAILKQSTINNPNNDLMNSHISFYNAKNRSSTTIKDIEYAGRLAMDQHNLALGIGTLNSQKDIDETTTPKWLGFNTAVGQYSMVRNVSGQYNTALGELALANSVNANSNTAVGDRAGRDLDIATPSGDPAAEFNTAIGALALTNHQQTRQSTAVGYKALHGQYGNTTKVIGSTAVGAEALNKALGSGNTAVGTEACHGIESGKYNLCLGYQSGNAINLGNGGTLLGASKDKNYMLHIGVGTPNNATERESYYSDMPLIFGRMQYDVKNSLPRTLIVNTDEFEVRDRDASEPIFYIENVKQTTGGVNHISSIFEIAPYEPIGSSTTPASVLKISGDQYGINMTFNEQDANKTLKINNGAFTLSSPQPTTSGSSTTLASATINSSANRINLFSYKTSGNTPYLITADRTKNNYYMKFEQDFEIRNNSKAKQRISMDTTGTINVETADNVKMNMTTTNTTFKGDVIVNGKATVTSDLFVKGRNILAEIDTISSDERLKNISGDNTAGLEEINKIEVKNYTYKKDKDKTPHVGVIAQQLQKIFPNSVITGEDGFLRIRTEEIFYAMVNSIKELCAKIQDLTAKVTGLEAKITELEKENAELKKQNADFEARLQKLEEKLK